MPAAAIGPIAGIAEAVSLTLLGLRNGLDPRLKLDEKDVWDCDIPNSVESDRNTHHRRRKQQQQQQQGWRDMQSDL